MISPWAIYNLTRYQEPTLLTTNFGGALAISNCPPAYHGPYIGFWANQCYRTQEIIGVSGNFAIPGALAQRGEDTSTLDLERRRLGIRYAREHLRDLPAVFLAVRAARGDCSDPSNSCTWILSPGRSGCCRRASSAYWALAALAVAGAYALRRRRLTLWILASFVVVVFITTVITFGQTRYRAPADVALVMLAAVGVDRLVKRSRAPRRESVEKSPRPARRERLPSVYIPPR